MHKALAVDEAGQRAIYGLLEKVQAAWASGDPRELAALFSEDAVFVPFDGSRLIGRDQIVQFHAEPFATHFRGAKLVINVVEIRALADGIYLVATNGGPLRAGSTHRPVHETQTFICRQLGGRWTIAFFQNTPRLSHGPQSRSGGV